MTLTFIGTRANIETRSLRHRRHTSTLVSYRGARIMIDCGADWLDRIHRVRPDAIVLTHGHSDHVDGLRHGSPCPVFATAEVWDVIEKWRVRRGGRLRRRAPTKIRGVMFEAFRLEHSIHAPTVGYRVRCGRTELFYAPDVLNIPDRRKALGGIGLYIGDGASIDRPIVRYLDDTAIGHASIGTQLSWCEEAGVPRAIFTHCGSRIVAGPAGISQRISTMGSSCGVETQLAFDGLTITLR